MRHWREPSRAASARSVASGPTEPRPRPWKKLRPRSRHPDFTQEVAPNESQRGPSRLREPLTRHCLWRVGREVKSGRARNPKVVGSNQARDLNQYRLSFKEHRPACLVVSHFSELNSVQPLYISGRKSDRDSNTGSRPSVDQIRSASNLSVFDIGDCGPAQPMKTRGGNMFP